MDILRRTSVTLLAALLPLLLFAAAFDFGVVRTAGQSGEVKKILADSGVYHSVIPAALEQAADSSGNGQVVSLIDPTVKKAAQEVFTPGFLQKSTENIIDGIYDWLNGKTPLPDFKIDLSGQKTAFAGLVADHAKQQAQQLPVCTTLPATTNFDVFNATCIPYGVTPSAVRNQVYQELINNKDFLKTPVITAGDIKAGDSNQSVFDQQKQVPKYFQWIKRTPIILSLLALATAAGIVFLSSSRKKGLRRVGIILTIVGVVMLVFAWGFNYAVTKQALPRLNLNNQVIQNDIKSLATDLVQAINYNYWLFGGIYACLGAVTIGSSIFLFKNRSVPVEALAENSEPAPKTRPKKTPQKIQ